MFRHCAASDFGLCHLYIVHSDDSKKFVGNSRTSWGAVRNPEPIRPHVHTIFLHPQNNLRIGAVHSTNKAHLNINPTPHIYHPNHGMPVFLPALRQPDH